MKEKEIILFIHSKKAHIDKNGNTVISRYAVMSFSPVMFGGVKKVFETNSREELKIWLELMGYVLKLKTYPSAFANNVKNGSVASFYLEMV